MFSRVLRVQAHLEQRQVLTLSPATWICDYCRWLELLCRSCGELRFTSMVVLQLSCGQWVFFFFPCNRSIGWGGSSNSSSPSPSVWSRVQHCCMCVAFPDPVRGLQLLSSARSQGLLPCSVVPVSVACTKSALFLSLFFFPPPPVQSNVGFCFLLPQNKTISSRRICKKERFFSHFMFGCERS